MITKWPEKGGMPKYIQADYYQFFIRENPYVYASGGGESIAIIFIAEPLYNRYNMFITETLYNRYNIYQE